MKNLYRVTRPAWASMDKSETVVILIASLFLGIYGGWGEQLATNLLELLKLPTAWLGQFWPIIDVIVVTFGCLLLIWIYKKLRVGCYPSTFIYCFIMPEASNSSGKSQVVGYLSIRPNMDRGDIFAQGASFFWDGGLNVDSRVGFRSIRVYGIEEDGETTCYIRFNIDHGDLTKRLYRHGLLQFRFTETHVGRGEDRRDTYAGYLQSTHKDLEIQDVGIRSRGYAEWWGKGTLVEDEVQAVLRAQGDVLFAKLNSMLGNVPPPSLWRAKDHAEPTKSNFWGHKIPTPQAVVLNSDLRPYVDAFLNNVLGAYGLRNEAIEGFKRSARTKARLEDETLIGYERDLKAGLIGLKSEWKEDQALTNRARLICQEITPFLAGDSLLDIGCGNGLVANCVRDRFSRILLLDVVRYVPYALNLDFKEYKEGDPLPIDELFDTVLLLTVLHHASDPAELLKLAWAATRNRLIIIESVVGIHEAIPSVKYELVALPDEYQIAFAAFVDWFYNRVLHDNVPVPYNFTTPERWQSLFVQLGMRLVQAVHFGQDIEIGPEYHILFVLEK